MATVTVRDFRDLGGENAAADCPSGEQPAAENIAVLVGVGRIASVRIDKIAAGLGFGSGRGVNGLGVGHEGRPSIGSEIFLF